MIWHIVYLSYECGRGGRNYIGKHSTKNLHDNYMGSFSDKTFNPDSRIILGVYNSAEAAVQAEAQWQRVFEVVPNPEFANKSYQTSSKFDTTGTEAYNKGKPRTEQEKRAISEGTKRALKEMGFSNKGERNPMYGRRGESHPFFGKHRSQETRQKISRANKGRRASEETRRKMSASGMGNTNKKGKKGSEEKLRKRYPNYAIVMDNASRIKEWWEVNKNRKMPNGTKVGAKTCSKELNLQLTGFQALTTFLKSI